MKVLRFENEDGYGPYINNKEIVFSFFNKHLDASIYPGMYQDIFNKDIEVNISNESLYCGFLNIKQTLSWFTQEDIMEMYRKGFCLFIYDTIEEVFSSKKQVLFEKKACLDTKKEIPFEKYMTKRTLKRLAII